MSEPIQIVDENDRPTHAATKQQAWDQGLRHRVVRIMIENDHGEMLLQHRSPTKDIFPDTWDNSAAGHVDAGEDYEEAARRELEEELGFKDLNLTEVGKYSSDETWRGHRLKRFTTVYRAHSNELPRKLEAGKVDDARWFSIDAVSSMVRQHPEKVSDGLRQVVELYYAD